MKKNVILGFIAVAFALLAGFVTGAKAGTPDYYVQVREQNDSMYVYTHTVKVTNGRFILPNLPPGTYRVSIIAVGDPHGQNPGTTKGSLNFSFVIDGTSNTIVSVKPNQLRETDGDVTVLPAGSPAPQLGVGRTQRSAIRGDRTLAPAKLLTITKPGTVQGIIAILIGL